MFIPNIMSPEYSELVNRYIALRERMSAHGWTTFRGESGEEYIVRSGHPAANTERMGHDFDRIEKLLDDDNPAFYEREASKARGI